MPDLATIYLLLFADDVVLISDTAIGLQNQLDVLVRESSKIGLAVNIAKTKVVVFRNGGFLAEHEKWMLGEERLEVMNEYKYLGAVFSTRLSYRTMQKDLAQRGRASMLQVIRCCSKVGCVSPDFVYKLFDAQVTPVLLYSSELWGMKDCTDIERVHLQSLKRFLHLPPQAPNAIVYGETGRYSLSITAKLRAIKYWLKILRMDSSRYPRKVYDMMLHVGNNTWINDIQNLLYSHDFENEWRSQTVQNEVQFIRLLKKRLIEEFIQDWSDTIAGSDRYSFYRSFKNVFTSESYLYTVDKQIYRDILIHFRAGVSQLYAHRYRFYKEDTDQFTCPSCNEEEEDEEHVLFRCPAYAELRKKFMFRLFDPLLHINIHDLFNCNDVETTRSLSMYLFYTMKQRQDAIINRECLC